MRTTKQDKNKTHNNIARKICEKDRQMISKHAHKSQWSQFKKNREKKKVVYIFSLSAHLKVTHMVLRVFAAQRSSFPIYGTGVNFMNIRKMNQS